MAPAFPIEYTGQKLSKSCMFSKMMGKKRKYSKGHLSSGFVPDYRHEAGMMGESEGFGSSGRVDAEMTASGDSYAPKRKSISLNTDGCDNFFAPIKVLSLSNMSRPERKDLEMRLRTELERVRILQKRVVLMSSNVPILSPSSDIHSGGDGKKRPRLESFGRSSELQAGQGKKRAPPGRSGSLKQAASLSSSNAMLMKQCETLLNRLMSHQHGWIFNTPVDVVKFNIPDYFTIIKNPMDLGTVKGKLVSGKYTSPRDFAADVRLTFSNARTYNPPGNSVRVMADILSKYFEVRWKAIEKKLPAVTNLESAVPSVVDLETDSVIQPSKKPRPSNKNHKNKPWPVERMMSEQAKHALGTELETLLGELPENIVDFLKENSYSEGQMSVDEIEIDIDALGDNTLFALRKLLDDYLLEKQKKMEKAVSSEVEIPIESGLSNSSMQPRKGDDPVDEDVLVDIGGNEAPILGYPPIEIEKDATLRNKCSSSSSSSSGSGSTSSVYSDSDSASSSGSELDGVEVSVPAEYTKDTLSSRANITVIKTAEAGTVNQSLIGSDQVDQSSQTKPVSTETDDQQDGESAPSERQVSPEKLYRAALLRNRFADTILKAREKTLEKAEKLDPEKLRLEKEELERRQKEEKARLRSEAKAAEDARRKAEAEAVAEARKKRELEREAARLALQKMGKTVDINENSQFIKDLEMLRGAPVEQLTFVDETSTEHSLSALGSFKFEGSSNPLEQLGLYMKDEEDEEEGEPQGLAGAEMGVEEEGEPQRIPEPENDVEEESEAQRIVEPKNFVEEEGEVQRIVEPVNDEEEEGEPQRIAEAVNEVEVKEAAPWRTAEPVNVVEEDGSEAQRIDESESHVEEEGRVHRIVELVNDEEEDGEPQRIAEAVDDVEAEEAAPWRTAEPVNFVEEDDSEPQRMAKTFNNVEEDSEPQSIPVEENSVGENGDPHRITESVNDVGEDDSEPKRIAEAVNDVEEDDGEPQRIIEEVNDMEEVDGEPPNIPVPVNGVEENVDPQRITESVNDIEDGDSMLQRVTEAVKDVEEHGGPQRITESVNDVEEDDGEPQRIVESIDVEEVDYEPLSIPLPVKGVEENDGPLRNADLVNDVEKGPRPESIHVLVNGVEENCDPQKITKSLCDVGEEDPELHSIPVPVNGMEERSGPQRNAKSVNDVEEGEGDPRRIAEAINDV